MAAATLGAVGIAVAAPRTPAPPATPNPGCTLQVPEDPLSARGLATPYRLSATDPRLGACHEAVAVQSAFVEATILDPAGGRLSVYHPLVVDAGAPPAAPPVVPALPRGAVVGLWFGFNGDTLTLRGSPAALRAGSCVNGLNGSLFGQVAFCGAQEFFAAAGSAVRAGKLRIPPLGRAKDGRPCPSVRDFSLVDQDQSDNVTTTYLATRDGRTAQATAANTRALAKPVTLANGSDNRLLDAFVDPALGCTPFTAPDLTDGGRPATSLALNELQAAAGQRAPVALVPEGDPMTLVAGKPSEAKANLYRAGVGQPPLDRRSAGTRSYCRNLRAAGLDRLTADRRLLRAAASPDDGVGLLKFLTDRLQGSLQQLGCTHPAASRHPAAAAEPDPADQAAAADAVRTLGALS
ncbi:hypothetical protein [Amycolatopsis australiensis]|uniref:hypothetical protein n=1 Tax=Amycolatopsis australiensis TaxID=546364 RepID=UPI001FE51409|nr:hypothetical protein [Amycolatopsis australiensis]